MDAKGVSPDKYRNKHRVCIVCLSLSTLWNDKISLHLILVAGLSKQLGASALDKTSDNMK